MKHERLRTREWRVTFFFFFLATGMVPPPPVGALSKPSTLHIGSGGTDFYRPRYGSYRTDRTARALSVGPQRGRGSSPLPILEDFHLYHCTNLGLVWDEILVNAALCAVNMSILPTFLNIIKLYITIQKFGVSKSFCNIFQRINSAYQSSIYLYSKKQ